MRVDLGTVDVSDDERLAIAKFYNERGLAGRILCRRFILAHINIERDAAPSARSLPPATPPESLSHPVEGVVVGHDPVPPKFVSGRVRYMGRDK